MPHFLKSLFAEHGYNLVSLPRTNIRPLDLLSEENGFVSPLGSTLDVLFAADKAPVPTIDEDGIVAGISGKQAVTMDSEIGLNFLDGIFKALKLKNSKLGANAELSKAKSLVFSFDNLFEDTIDELALDRFIGGAVPLVDEFKSYSERLLDSELFVITNVLKSNSFSVELLDGANQHINVEAAFEEIIDTKIDFIRKKDKHLVISPVEGQMLAFGFKACRIYYEKKKWFEFWSKKEAGFRIRKEMDIVLKGKKDIQIELLSPMDKLVAL